MWRLTMMLTLPVSTHRVTKMTSSAVSGLLAHGDDAAGPGASAAFELSEWVRSFRRNVVTILTH